MTFLGIKLDMNGNALQMGMDDNWDTRYLTREFENLIRENSKICNFVGPKVFSKSSENHQRRDTGSEDLGERTCLVKTYVITLEGKSY